MVVLLGVQGSPTARTQSRETYRHALAVAGAWARMCHFGFVFLIVTMEGGSRDCWLSLQLLLLLPIGLPNPPLSSAAVRPGTDGTPYIYTLNMSCPEELWVDLQPAFARGVAAFR